MNRSLLLLALPPQSVWRALSLLSMLSGAGTVLLGCSGDSTDPVSRPATQLYWALHLNAHAVNLATTSQYNTFQLTTTAFNEAGASMPGAGPVHYISKDSTVTVDSTGLVTAHYVTSRTQIIAALTVQGVTLADTAFVQVTQTPFAAPLNAFSIQPQPDGLDSAKSALNSYPILSVYATVATGNSATDTVCNVSTCPLLISYESSDSSIATIDQYADIILEYPGRVTLYATTSAYGVTKRDSLQFVVGYPLLQFVSVTSQIQTAGSVSGLSFSPAMFTIGVGGRVGFFAPSPPGPAGYDVIFDDSTGMTGFGSSPAGNIVQVCDTCTDNGNYGIRTFHTAGTYTYHSHTLGMTGTIIVSSGP